MLDLLVLFPARPPESNHSEHGDEDSSLSVNQFCGINIIIIIIITQ